MESAEATAVNNVLSYIGAKGPSPPADLVRSLYIFASRAHNRLQAGWHEHAVKRQRPYAFADGVPIAAASPTDPPTPSGPVNPA